MHKFQKSSCFEFESGYESGYYFVSLHRNIKNQTRNMSTSKLIVRKMGERRPMKKTTELEVISGERRSKGR